MTALVISYLVYLAVLAGFAAAAVYHARRFGFPGDKTLLATGIYLLLTIGIIVATFVILGGIEVSG